MEPSKVIAYMLKNNKTIDDLKAEKPQIFKQVFQGNEDNIYTMLADRNTEFHHNDPVAAQAATKRQLDRLGAKGLDERMNAYNRFSNGAALTVAQGMNGVNNFLQTLGFDGSSDIEKTTELLKSRTAKDSKLYKALNPKNAWLDSDNYNIAKKRLEQTLDSTPTDIATPAGQAFPEVVAGAVLPASKLGLLGDLGISTAVLNGTEDATTADWAAAMVAPLLGWSIANKLSKQTGKTYKSAKEYSDALKAEPSLTRDLAKMAKDKNLDLKDIAVHGDARLQGTNLPKTKAEYIEWKLKEGRKPVRTPQERDTLRRKFELDHPETVRMEKNKWVGLDDVKSEYNADFNLYLDDLDEAVLNNKIPVTLAGRSGSPDEFLQAVVDSEEALTEAGYGTLVDYAKNGQKLSGSDRTNFIMNSGLNGLLMASGNPGVAKLFPEKFKRWAGSLAKQSTNEFKEFMTKPR